MSVTDDWSVLDDLLGVEAEPVQAGAVGPVAFYGRCSTEDNQDPETSRGWQVGNALKLIEPFGGTIVEEYFDIGQSRSVPWERRDSASRLLRALKDPARKWHAVVFGEGTRCFFGNQFSLTAPKFAHADVPLWIPELGGLFDARNASHKMLMSVLGGMSESERQHVQARVRAAMDSQVLTEGRYQGGRAPYGYKVVNGGAHPNPRKAQEGYHLRVMVLDEPAAAVVRRIFALYLDGYGDRAIAHRMNRDGVPCPSAHTPQQNRHRIADGWQGSTVRSILDNPRYTGYAFFGRWERVEMLLNPDDVAAGNVTRFRRADKSRVIRSRRPAHPAIVSVETFTQVALRRRSRSAGGHQARAKLNREGRPTRRVYILRGLVRCGVCGRKMEASPRKHATYYRCHSRTLAPGSAALVDHPGAVYLREDPVVNGLNLWIADLFAPDKRELTVRALMESPQEAGESVHAERVRARIAEAETKLKRYQGAIAAGIDPAGLVGVMNDAQAELVAAQSEAANLPAVSLVTESSVRELVDQLGEMSAVLHSAEPQDLADLYRALRLEMRYLVDKDVVEVAAYPLARVVSERVRGGT